MIQWKWSYGESYERTPRNKKDTNEKQTNQPLQNIDFPNVTNITNVSMVEGAYQQSLLSENDVWTIDGPQFFGENGFHKIPNKREETYNKMSQREIIGQISQNPFLANHNYLNDITTQNQFLKPQSTTLERENSQSENS